MASELTAAELHKVLEGVDAECLPRVKDEWQDIRLAFSHDQYNLVTHIGQNVMAVHPLLAALMCEASMTRWLISEGLHSFEWESDCDDETLTLTMYAEEYTVPWQDEFTHCAALAQACRAVKGGGA